MANEEILELQIRDNAAEAAQGLNTLATAMNRIRSACTATGLKNYASSIEKLKNAVGKGFSGSGFGKIEKLKNTLSQIEAKSNFGKIRQNLSDSLSQSVGSGFSNVAGSIKEVSQSMQETMPTTVDFSNALNDAKNTAGETISAFETIKQGLNSVKTGFTNLIEPISAVYSQFKRIATRMLFRTIIKQFTSGIKEGIENVYHYSQAIKNGFSDSMDSAATSLLQMKNSLGAALAPLIQSLVPYLKTAVDWFINLINYANQFIALMRGQSTWTKATEKNAKAFDNVSKSGKKASNAIKELLADWDELNIIQSDTSSSGGATQKMEDYLGMFEEVGTFDSKIKNLTNFLKDNLGDCLDIAKSIGLALLGWKISQAFTGLLSTLGSLVAAGAIISVTWKMTNMFDNEYMRTGDKGWLVKDALVNAIGDVLAGTIVGSVLGGGVGVVTAGLALTVSAGISYGIALSDPENDNAETLKQFGLIKAAIGAAATAVGFGIVSGSAAVGIAAAAGFAAPLFVLSAAVSVLVQQVKTAQEIAKEAFSNAGKGGISVDEIFKALQDRLNELSSGYSLVIQSFSGASELKQNLADAFGTVKNLTGIVKGGDKLTTEEAKEFKTAWTTVFDSFKGITETSFDTIFKGLNDALTSENKEIRKQAKDLRVSLLMIDQNMSEAEAELKLEMDALADKISLGTAKPEEQKQYFAYLESMAQFADTSLYDLRRAIDEGNKIDFGNPQEAQNNLYSYLDTVSKAADEAKDVIDQGLDTEIEALREARKRNDFLLSVGKITQEAHDNAESLFNQTESVWKQIAEERKNGVEQTILEAYNLALGGTMEGIKQFKKDDGTFDALAALDYAIEYIGPILQKIKETGGLVDENFLKMFGIGVNLDNWDFQALGEFLEAYADGKATFDAFEVPEIKNKNFLDSADNTASAVESMANRIKTAIGSIDGLGYDFSGDFTSGKFTVKTPQTQQINTGMNLGVKQLASTGMSDVNYNSNNYAATGNSTQSVDSQRFIDGIVEGFTRALTRTEDGQRETNDLLRRINNKDFSVKVSPTATWGQFNTSSGRAFSKVTGEG